jgi:hypothetical protein
MPFNSFRIVAIYLCFTVGAAHSRVSYYCSIIFCCSLSCQLLFVFKMLSTAAPSGCTCALLFLKCKHSAVILKLAGQAPYKFISHVVCGK